MEEGETWEVWGAGAAAGHLPDLPSLDSLLVAIQTTYSPPTTSPWLCSLRPFSSDLQQRPSLLLPGYS